MGVLHRPTVVSIGIVNSHGRKLCGYLQAKRTSFGNQLRVGQGFRQQQLEHRIAEHVGVLAVVELLAADVRSERA